MSSQPNPAVEPIDCLFTNCRLTNGTSATLSVADGHITAIQNTDAPLPAAQHTIDVANHLVVPAFVEGHIHLDTSFYGDVWRPHKPCANGFDVRERVAFQMENLRAAAPMDVRARNQLDLCIGHGSLAMRSHVMVDAEVRLSHVEAILAVREEYRERIDIQLVAFPQSGIITSPGTADLLNAAIAAGCDVIGGLDPATIDHDLDGHLDVIFGIAERRGVGVDIHLHDNGTLGLFEIEQIAARTQASGLTGRVAISHAYGLGDVSPDRQKRTADLLARSGVAIMTNAPGNHPFPPVTLLRQAGVTVFSGSDNIRDSWWPYGDGDMLNRANLIGYCSGFYEDWELASAFDIVTNASAKALGLEHYGIAVGNKANFVTLPAAHVPEAVVAVPKTRKVYRAGKQIA